MKNFEYPGAIHIHTTKSDGSLPLEEIVNEAKKVGLKWLVFSDHNNIDYLKEGKEGFYDGICVIIANEISPAKGDHYIACNINELVSDEQPPEAFVQQVNELGGFGFIAHPDESTNRDNDYPPLRWTDWEMDGFTGIEIWNFMSDWVDNMTSKNKIHMFLNPKTTLTGPTQDVLAWWDSLNAKNGKLVPAIAGVDAHCLIHKFFGLPLKIFPYKTSFETLQNYLQTDDVLSSDFETAKRQIYTALKQGNNIMTNAAYGSPDGTVFTATTKGDDGRFIKASVGEILDFQDTVTVSVQTPVESVIQLYCDGEMVEKSNRGYLDYETRYSGSYRFESYINDALWLISNPIKIVGP